MGGLRGKWERSADQGERSVQVGLLAEVAGDPGAHHDREQSEQPPLGGVRAVAQSALTLRQHQRRGREPPACASAADSRTYPSTIGLGQVWASSGHPDRRQSGWRVAGAASPAASDGSSTPTTVTSPLGGAGASVAVAGTNPRTTATVDRRPGAGRSAPALAVRSGQRHERLQRRVVDAAELHRQPVPSVTRRPAVPRTQRDRWLSGPSRRGVGALLLVHLRLPDAEQGHPSGDHAAERDDADLGDQPSRMPTCQTRWSPWPP